MDITINPSTVYVLDGQSLLGEQLAIALQVCERVVLAYAEADEDNGGGGQVKWEHLNEAHIDATRALGVQVRNIQARARTRNGFIIVPADEEEDDDEATAELITLLTGKPWTPAQAASSRAMIDALQVARKKADDTEGGACD